MAIRSVHIDYSTIPLTELGGSERALCVAARSATALAYAPYSQFRVGASARVAGSNELVSAANLENAAYPQCICAEAALLATIHATRPGSRIEAIAIAVDSPRADPAGAAPCGSCRQQLFEAEQRQNGQPIELLLVGGNDEVTVFEKCSDLLPLGFVLAV